MNRSLTNSGNTMSNTFTNKDGGQNVGQGEHAIGRQENVTQEVRGDGSIFSGTGPVTVNQGVSVKPRTVLLASLLAAVLLGAGLAGWWWLVPNEVNYNTSGVPPEVFAKYVHRLTIVESALNKFLRGQQLSLSDIDNKLFQSHLGLTCANQRIMRELDLQGILVLNVESGSSAAKAGIRGTQQVHGGIILGDIIGAVNDVQVQDYNQFQDEIVKYKVGEIVTLTLLRQTGQVDVEVTIEVALKEM